MEAVDVDNKKDSAFFGNSRRTATVPKKSGNSGIEKDLDLSKGNGEFISADACKNKCTVFA